MGENSNNSLSLPELKKRLIDIYSRQDIPEPVEYLGLLEKINSILISENAQIRPHDASGKPGGIIYLKQNIPTIIVPDLHARMDFLLNILFLADREGRSSLSKLASDKLQIVCVGDGFHAEARAIERWKLAFEEYKSDYEKHKNIDEEMRESLGLMEIVLEMKSNFPSNFHFLKGNHENIGNEKGGGNYPFLKFTYEGAMVTHFITKFYGEAFLETYSFFEKNLPLLAVGRNFLVSHAEPASIYSREKLVEYRNNPEVIEGLTWTDDDSAEEGSVQAMLKHYIQESELANSFYFSGHRPTPKLFNQRASSKFIQLHNPNKFIIAVIKEDRDIDLEKDIIELENNINEILKPEPENASLSSLNN